jgi:hypothetical protein
MLALLAACSDTTGGDLEDSGVGAGASAFTVLAEGLDGALLSIQGGPSGVYAVGADVGAGPLVLRHDGSAWSTIPTGTSGDLWWVFPTALGAVMGGASGQLLRYDAGTGGVEAAAGPAGITFYGIWGATDDDLWAVGGDPFGEEPAAVWRYAGGAWAALQDPLLDTLTAPSMLYKVHGTDADDVWIVGTDGRVLHWDGAALSAEDSGSTSNLYTVHTGGSVPIAVGGFGQSVVLHRDAGEWVDRSPAFTAQTNGVYARGDTAVGVGSRGAVIRWDGAAWQPDPLAPTAMDLHAVYVDPDGGVWTVGGALTAFPLTDGVLLYDGPADVPELP